MSWYKEWFDSPWYERIYADRDDREARRLVKWLQEVLPPHQYPEVLDLGCGRGRHALNMAEAGYRVKGVDLSESAIRQARDNAGSRGLDDIEFVVGDMREKRPETYDLVVNLFTSFGYFEDDSENARVIGNVSEMLRPQGVLVIDYFNSEKVRNQYQPYETGQVDEISYEIFRYIEEGAIFKEIKFNGRALNEKSSYQERVKLYNLEWFEETLNDYQLTLENVYGDYDGSSYVPGESPRMIIMARK